MASVKTTIKAFACIGMLASFGASALTLMQKDKADPGPPRMLASLGCDGSTAILVHAYKILPLHGINPGESGQKELLDPQRNPFITDDNKDIVVAMQRLADERRQAGTTLVFKSIFKRDHVATLDSRMVHDMGVRAVLSVRRNVLDKLVCMVRDCFLNEWWHDDVSISDTQYGYPVNDQGRLNRMCFNRRASDAPNSTRAMLVASELKSNLDWLVSQEDDAFEELKAAGYNAPRVVYEDMLAFEQDAAKIPVSVQAWSATLEAWGVKPNLETIEQYMRNNANTQELPEKHFRLIYNMNEVKDALQEAGTNYLGFLRE